jgi:UPF0176 protein
MRARLAILASGIRVELRDILLKDKPVAMTEVSPKATVPVLVFPDGTVLEESLDIVFWALDRNDPEGWMPGDAPRRAAMLDLIRENDGPFKAALDRYKYHVRFPEMPRKAYRSQGEEYLGKLDARLAHQAFLLNSAVSVADIAIFPFVRQFANSDRDWFDSAPYPHLRRWLGNWTQSPAFLQIMKKRPIWKAGTRGPVFPDLDNGGA